MVQRRGDWVMIKQIAENFGIVEACLQNWLRKTEIESGHRPGTTVAESAEVRDLRKCNRLLKQNKEVLRRAVAYLSQADSPKKGSTRS